MPTSLLQLVQTWWGQVKQTLQCRVSCLLADLKGKAFQEGTSSVQPSAWALSVYDIESIQLSYILCDEQNRKVQLKLITSCPAGIFILYAVPQAFKICMPPSHTASWNSFILEKLRPKLRVPGAWVSHLHGKVRHIRRLNWALCIFLLWHIMLHKKGPDLSHFYFFSIWPLSRCRSINSDTFPRYLFLHQFSSQTEPSPLLYYVHMIISLTYYQITPSFPTRLPSCHTKA